MTVLGPVVTVINMVMGTTCEDLAKSVELNSCECGICGHGIDFVIRGKR